MSNLQKFNETLKDFDNEVDKLKDVSGAYQKLQGLTLAYDEISKQFDVNSKALDKINELQKIQQERVSKSLLEIENTNVKGKTELTELIEKKIEQLRQENKKFYIDLESTIKIKLDDNKSQIKQLIENERNQIKQIFENEINKQTELLANNQKTIKISIWLFGAILLILSALSVYKLWVN